MPEMLLNVLGSMKASSPKTTTTSNQYTNLGSSTQNQWSQPTFSPELQTLMSSLANYSQQSTANPTAALAPIRNAALQNINTTYAGVPDQVARQMASRGYGSSGAMGSGMFNTNLQRANSVAGMEGQLANLGVQQSQFGASLGNQLLNTGRGSMSDAFGSNYSTGRTLGTTTTPNNATAAGLLAGGSALGNLAQLFGALSGMP